MTSLVVRDLSGFPGFALDLKEITPHDTNPVEGGSCWGIKVEEAGNVKVTTYEGTEITVPMQAGEYLKCRITHVWDTGSDDVGIIVGYYA